MKILHIAFIIFFFLLRVTFSAAQISTLTTAKSSDELYDKEKLQKEKDHLLSLEEQWLFAEIKLDTVLIFTLLDSAYMGISEYGVYSRDEELANMLSTMEDRRKNNISIDSFEIRNGMVNLHNNAAVVTFILHTFRNENGIPVQRKTRYYDVWVKKGERWVAVSSQGCIVKE